MAILSDFVHVVIDLQTGGAGGGSGGGGSTPGQTEPLLLADFTAAPGIYPHPAISFRDPVKTVTYGWSSSDYSIVDFDSNSAPVRLNLKTRGAAIVTLTVTLDDGTELKASSNITVL